MSGQKVSLPVAKGVTIETSADGKQTALVFKTSQAPGFFGVAIANAELSRTVSLLLFKRGRLQRELYRNSHREK